MRAATVHLARFLAALALAWASGHASAQTNTMGVVSATLASAPSCISYRVTGVCFFLRCTPFGCTVETSIRVSHYMPDVVVSTFNDQYIHPWRDVG
ncbi:MAG: TraU family protein, partial [Hydrogenophaga sp.]|nr:TraU family protein [Hydrogenophaga sp.]